MCTKDPFCVECHGSTHVLLDRRVEGEERAHTDSRFQKGQVVVGQLRVTAWNGKAYVILSAGEQARMFVRCAHHNVRSFSASVSRAVALFSANVSGRKTMFVRRCY